MADPISLIKANPLLPAEDYVALRKQGFKLIEQLGSDVWTDYNNSDPGITILEAVCYAITDLAYRTGFDIKDILTPEHLTGDTWKQIFYTARQILHNSPVTINDYRKLIIDVKGVRNAWIEPSKDYEAPIWVDYNAWEHRKELDCACEDTAKLICLGKLGLSPVTATQAQAQADNKISLNKIDAEIKTLDAQIALLEPKLKDPETTQADKRIIEAQIKKIQAERVALVAMRTEHTTTPVYISPKILELEGLYNVLVEYEEDVIEEQHREAVRQVVISRLSHHRNLCEDFLSINAIEYEDVAIEASIELEEYADPDVVLAEIFFTVYKYFTPSIPFHTIDQLLDQGYQVDEMFEGPALKHGFIDTVELEKTDLFRDIRLSDIINEIADIKGIKGILYFHLLFKDFDRAKIDKNYFNEWVKYLHETRKIARIQPTKSSVMFCKNRDFISYFIGRPEDRRPERMLKLFKDMKTLERKYKLEGQAVDFPVPVGEYMQLSDYYPVTESLPMCYGVSKRMGLPEEAKHKAQVLQLKGYLLFFEQIMAGYLLQLSHLKDLFTFDDSVKHTYFGFDTLEIDEPECEEQHEQDEKSTYHYVSKWLNDIDQLQALIIDHEKHAAHEGCKADAFEHILNNFIHTMQNLLETPKLYGTRRNRFLDHLLARFSEDLSEYEKITRWLTPDKVDERLIKDKINILKDREYFRISSNRGQGYNYALQEFWDTFNISGTERRVSRLLGFSTVTRRTLAPDIVTSEPFMEGKTKTQKKNAKGRLLNVIKLFDPDNKSYALLTSVEVVDGCCTDKLMTEILFRAGDRKNFQFKEDLKHHSRKTAGLIGTFWFELWDGSNPETAVLLASSERFDKKTLRDAIFHKLLTIMAAIDQNEGLHLVEHLLLRPRFDVVFNEADEVINAKFLDICLDKCDLGIGIDDGVDAIPYQKRVHRIRAEKCYDKMPWVLEYIRTSDNKSMLFQSVPLDNIDTVLLKFRRYEYLARRVRDLQEFGSERKNYEIVSNQQEGMAGLKYGFIIHGDRNVVLAQSLFIFNRKLPASTVNISDDIEKEIEKLMDYFQFELDLYCEANPCDNNEDPYSFRTTAVLPCWPKRFRDPTFRNLVEKTIQVESPAHVHTRIVWLGLQEMQRFETAYGEWLLEMSQTEMPSFEKTNPLVDVLNTLRPCGVCDDECD